MAEDLEGDILINGLKQLVVSFGPFIQDAGQYEQAEDNIIRMEEHDPNFHR